MKKSCLVILALVAMWGLTHMAVNVQTADAAGFHLFEWGNRGNAMGGAVLASPNPDPSTIASNPAGMTKLEGTQTLVGSTFIAPSATLKRAGEDSVTTKGKVYTVPHAYVSYQLDDNWWFGFGEFSRFGLGTNYDHDWGGAQNVYKASVETISFQPTVGYKVNDKLSLAVGAELLLGRMDLRQNVQVIGEDIHMHPEGMSWTWVAAAQYEVSDMVNVGLTFRKGFVFKGRGDFSLNDKVIDDVTLSANFPGTLSAGIAITPRDDLSFEFDVVHSFWSDFKSMEYDFSSKINASSLAVAANNTTSLKNYRDSTRLQFGAEYEAWDDIFLRAGYVYDPTPQNSDYMDYMLPANDRNLFSTGLGWEYGDFAMDFSFVYLISNDYTIDNNVAGTVTTEVSGGVTKIGGLNFSYKF